MTPVLAAQVKIIRAAADLVEQSGVEDLAVMPGPDEIVIQVPGYCGTPAERAARVAALAALAGCEAAPDTRHGATRGWVTARGLFAGHPVRIYTPAAGDPS